MVYLEDGGSYGNNGSGWRKRCDREGSEGCLGSNEMKKLCSMHFSVLVKGGGNHANKSPFLGHVYSVSVSLFLV